MAFVIPSNHYMWWTPAFLEMAEPLPAHGEWWMNYLLCFACTCSFFFNLLHCLYLNPQVFLTFTFLILCPTHWGEWVNSCGAELTVEVKPPQYCMWFTQSVPAYNGTEHSDAMSELYLGLFTASRNQLLYVGAYFINAWLSGVFLFCIHEAFTFWRFI